MIDITAQFTEQISSGNFQLMLLGLSFLGGLIASISPCSLAMLPIVIGYIGGFNENDNKNTLLQLTSFVIGSAIVFSISEYFVQSQVKFLSLLLVDIS